jgi:(p)ppGpp synthase/HD superfamily hydrolase
MDGKCMTPKEPVWLEQARSIALVGHAGQYDKSGGNYFDHTERVADMAPVDDYEGRAAAYLHDVLEDTEFTERMLRLAGIPMSVVDAVEALTHRNHEPNETYWNRVKLNDLALRVKLWDIDDNMDQARLAALDPETRERLTLKYTKARAILGG